MGEREREVCLTAEEVVVEGITTHQHRRHDVRSEHFVPSTRPAAHSTHTLTRTRSLHTQA